MAPEWLHMCPVDREDITMRGVPLVFAGSVVPMVEHLHLDASQKRDTRRRDGRAPNEHARIPTAREVAPFDFENEVFVLTLGAHCTGRVARAMDHAVGHKPRLGRAICIHPTRKIATIE